MARRRRSRSEDTAVISSELPELLREVHPLPTDPLSNVDTYLGPTLPFDEREFSFGLNQEPFTLGVDDVTSPEIGYADSVRVERVPHGVRFNAPDQVAVCVRRQQRREVLFAQRKIRKRGGSGSRRYRWSSKIKC